MVYIFKFFTKHWVALSCFAITDIKVVVCAGNVDTSHVHSINSFRSKMKIIPH